MEVYPIGRFSIAIPIRMKLDGCSHRLRLTSIEEVVWSNSTGREVIRDRLWKNRVAEIEKRDPPDGKRSVIIEQRDFDGLGQWAKGVFYYKSCVSLKEGIWEVLIDYGPSGILLKTDSAFTDSENVKKLVRNIDAVAKAYHPKSIHNRGKLGECFYLPNGALDLPYRWQEEIYARFEGHPLDLKLEIDMTDVHVDEPKREGLLARTAAAILTGFAFGVDIKKIRSHDRKVAGIVGEEQVVRMKDKDESQLDFTWRYAGKKDSGEYPKIVISMESPEGNLDEKLKIWDAILDSVKPLYKTSQ